MFDWLDERWLLDEGFRKNQVRSKSISNPRMVTHTHNKTTYYMSHIQEAKYCQTSNCEEESYDKRVWRPVRLILNSTCRKNLKRSSTRNESGRQPLFVVCHFIHSLFKKCRKTQSLLPFHVQVLTMPKHKHMLDVLLEDRWIDIQDENLLMCVSLSESSLCVTEGNNKAAMNS